MSSRIGKQTVVFQKPIYISESFTCVGNKERLGPLGDRFDMYISDDKWGEKSYEKCERKMFAHAMRGCAEKAGVPLQNISAIIAGDLLNQTISASFSALEFDGSFIGLYGACSTMAESLAVGCCMIDSGALDNAICMTGSHFCTAERQYRMPLDMGTQKTPTSQITVTGVGATLIGDKNTGACITSVTFGKVIDMGISDANNMGAAMAPAAADTIAAHINALGSNPSSYDAIITGDLGKFGRELTLDMLESKYNINNVTLLDCGCCIFDTEQDAHMGGSGCGCSAVTLNGYFLPIVKSGMYKKILFVATGALLSLTSTMQGDNIPSIAHAVEIKYCGE